MLSLVGPVREGFSRPLGHVRGVNTVLDYYSMRTRCHYWWLTDLRTGAQVVLVVQVGDGTHSVRRFQIEEKQQVSGASIQPCFLLTCWKVTFYFGGKSLDDKWLNESVSVVRLYQAILKTTSSNNWSLLFLALLVFPLLCGFSCSWGQFPWRRPSVSLYCTFRQLC